MLASGPVNFLIILDLDYNLFLLFFAFYQRKYLEIGFLCYF